ncbi:MAG TPA: hypothetical protein VFG07_01000 [Thermoplasmata archaeon]|nr:hypothetical protein [Thermoplasmata archaeon]
MSGLSIDQQVTLAEILVILLGIAITWAIYYGSEHAELPGEAAVPDPNVPDEIAPDIRGRTL